MHAIVGLLPDEALRSVEHVVGDFAPAFRRQAMHELRRRRGVLQGLEDAPAGKIVRAEVPLAEMFGYATQLRSMSQGRATYTMEFAHYAEVPSNVADVVIKGRRS